MIKIWTENEDGTRTEVTEAVQCLYDLLLSSMDFGSGFLSVEEIIPIAELADAAGFDPESPISYLRDQATHIGVTYEPNRLQAEKAVKWLGEHGHEVTD